MLRCRDVVELIGTDALTAAPLRRRLAVRLHLGMCQHCRAYARSLRRLAESARALAGMDAPPETAREREMIREVRRAAETWDR